MLLIAITSLVSFALIAQDPTAAQQNHFNLSKNGLAIDGYDPVGYFKSNKAIKGKKEFAVDLQGAVYYFSSIDNREAFIKNPAAYEPQYGGWCAYAMGKDGDKVNVDPETFKITNGRLFLFYNKFFNNTLNSWNKDETNLKARADANWQKAFH